LDLNYQPPGCGPSAHWLFAWA